MNNPSKPKSLLHVDDDPSWREIFAEVADDLGLKLRQCQSREEAVHALQETELPDIVITDLHLGKEDQSGYFIAQTARERGVRHVTIASATMSPSQRIPGVEIQDKPSAGDWLHRLVRGGER